MRSASRSPVCLTPGDRPALLLVPGLLCDDDLYAAQREALAELADVVVPDIRPAHSPLDGHEEIARLAPRARLAVLEDCGHLSTWEQPDAVTGGLRRWLADD